MAGASVVGAGVTLYDNFGEKKDGVVTAQWYDTESHYRYVVIKMKIDLDDTDELEEVQAEIEKRPQSSGSKRRRGNLKETDIEAPSQKDVEDKRQRWQKHWPSRVYPQLA